MMASSEARHPAAQPLKLTQKEELCPASLLHLTAPEKAIQQLLPRPLPPSVLLPKPVNRKIFPQVKAPSAQLSGLSL